LAIAHSKITPLTGIQRNIHPGCHHSNKTSMTGTALFTTAECFINLYNIYTHTHTHMMMMMIHILSDTFNPETVDRIT